MNFPERNKRVITLAWNKMQNERIERWINMKRIRRSSDNSYSSDSDTSSYESIMEDSCSDNFQIDADYASESSVAGEEASDMADEPSK